MESIKFRIFINLKSKKLLRCICEIVQLSAAKIAAELGTEKQIEYFKTMKLFSPLKIEILEKSTPMTPDKWSESTLITGILRLWKAVTPIYLV
ncbi:penicillin-binding domain protein [Wolbachia endosymbiont of Wuchereria bancrofti]|nr:penicillin-binding domain protein [Wolbachia endosymbiont of Wuchereria bancrofti]